VLPINLLKTQIWVEALEPPRAYVPFHLAVKSSQPHDKEKTAWSFAAAKIVISFETQKENGVFFHFLEKFHRVTTRHA
jgi:hypothetical protein